MSFGLTVKPHPLETERDMTQKQAFEKWYIKRYGGRIIYAPPIVKSAWIAAWKGALKNVMTPDSHKPITAEEKIKSLKEELETLENHYENVRNREERLKDELAAYRATKEK